MRATLKARTSTPIIELLSRMRWLSVRQLIFYHSVITLYRILNTGNPVKLFDKLTFDNRTSSIVTRGISNNNLPLNNYRLQTSKNSFIHRSVNYWNQIPLSIRNIQSMNNFKFVLKVFIKSNIPPV